MKIAVTGASSFIGRHLVQRLLLRDDVDLVQVTSRASTVDLGCRTVWMDLANYHQLADVVGSVDCLVNLAWHGTRGASRLCREEQEHARQCTMAGIRSVLEAGCRKIVLAGSQAEYGAVNGLISEATACCPNTEYGKSKLRLFQEASVACEEAGAVCIDPRFFSLYGPDDYVGTMVISILQKMRRGEACELTEGVQNWDFLYIDDAAVALAGLVLNKVPSGAYNFGSGDCRQLREFVMEMKQLCSSTSELKFGSVPYPATGMVSICPDVIKLKQTLGWRPTIGFDEGIRRILKTIEDVRGCSR